MKPGLRSDLRFNPQKRARRHEGGMKFPEKGISVICRASIVRVVSIPATKGVVLSSEISEGGAQEGAQSMPNEQP
jgi:hypothetical protein